MVLPSGDQRTLAGAFDSPASVNVSCIDAEPPISWRNRFQTNELAFQSEWLRR